MKNTILSMFLTKYTVSNFKYIKDETIRAYFANIIKRIFFNSFDDCAQKMYYSVPFFFPDFLLQSISFETVAVNK